MFRLLLQGFRKNQHASQLGSIRKLGILLILASGFIVLVAVLAGFALERIKAKIQADAGEALQIVLQTTQESLNLWVESNKFQVRQLADTPRLISLVERQLSVPRTKEGLSGSGALQGLRNFFWHRKDRFGQAGIFFIISPDLVNIASIRDENIGAKNLIANQALDYLNQAFRGAAVMVPPIWSDDALSLVSNGRLKNKPTMFIAAPVKNIQEKIIAVIAQQIDPAGEFTRLIQLGRLGKSGETYAFDRYGKLLSQSRFEDDLRNAGLLGKDETSILLVSLRDPGGDMTKGYIPAVPRYQQPLTRMAQEATQGKSGSNVTGYRDYRGVSVYGAWLWDDKLGIGLATEIDASDALGPYYATRTVILTLLGITVLLALGSLVFAVVIEERASRALQKSHAELEFRVEERTAELKEKQVRLAESEERFRDYFEHSQVGMAITSPDKRWIEVNGQLQQMLGYNLDDLRRMTWAELTHPDDLEADLKNFEQMLAGEIDDYAIDKRFIRKDGKIVHTNLTVSCPRNEDGSVQNVLASIMDITERKEAEQALLESRATARGLLDATQESLLLLDKEGTIIAINQTAARRNQKSPEALIGTNRFNILPEDLRSSRKAHFTKVLQTGEPEKFEDVRDGMVFHHIYYPVRDKQNAIIGVAIFAQDITERKQAEEAVRESRERLDTILKTTAQGFWLNDQDDNLMDVNDAMCKILGLTKEDVVGRNFFDFLDEKNREIVRGQNRMRKKGIHSLYEISLIRADGQQVPCLMNASPLLDKDGNVVGSFGMTTNIAERKQMEEELRRNVDELERFSKVAFGREKKMIQLKQEINELMLQLGQGEKYKIVH